MGTLLLLTSALQPSADVLPGLALLPHQVKILPPEGSALLEAPASDLVLIDGRRDLAQARDLCRLIRTTGSNQPVLLIVTEGGLAVVAADWGMDDVVLESAGPAEIDGRIRIALGRLDAAKDPNDPEAHIIRGGEVVVDEATYTAKLGRRTLDLTFKEFELLKYLVQHPGRVFTRDQLLQEVWGYDYFGGTRTVDVHVRRLRAKLGPENESLIGTVRNVGYRFVLPPKEKTRDREEVPANFEAATVSLARIDPSDFDSDSGTGPAAEVRRIAEACDVADGVITLNEQACLQLKYRGLRDASLWLGDEGFALLHGQILDLAVHPMARNRGTGTALARLALAEVAAGDGRIEAWSHGDHPSAGRIAARLGVPKERELRIMSRPTSLPLVPIDPPPGVRIRTFTPADEPSLLEVNAAAFSHHPEQGHMTHEDFLERTKEAWFDANGLFLAVPEDEDPLDPEILGFHWTKVHRDENPPYGEVYVVATSPKAVGRGLGSVLTSAGLVYLGNQGVDDVILYVDGDNAPAIAVYDRQGFTTVRTEVQYRGTVDGSRL